MTKLDITKLVKAEAGKLANRKMQQIVTALRAATPVDTGAARDGWRIDGKTIRNDVEYIDHLNQGSSEQAPSFFVEKTILAQVGVKPNGIVVRSQ